MARPRQPTQLHVVKNTGKKHPERMRDREDEPVPSAGIGPAPKHLSAQARKAWCQVVETVAPGVLGNSDRLSLEILSNLIAEYRKWKEEFPASRLTQLISLCGRFGLTPSDRSKISVPKGHGKNPFGGF